ncbi:hypothetical protein [Massilia yuzhufengensis]|uniref:Probable extracellular repeat, HAF family n=1 Tax=Massilia yuzhufengensis TaxID=1164594 RepID=A0A1I1VJL7_9BURK|nr:hypothetical protein [Massilia yuzhufengensis]SFD82238.1 probable extracellular repeat, HAF family [Massilia yuzhufengensis]
MRRIHENGARRGRGIRRLPCLLAFLAITGAAAAAPAQDAQAGGKHGHKTSYRIVNLNAGEFSALPRINASGQVAYSVRMGMGPPRGYFYDGAVLHDIGDLGGTDTYAVALNNAGQVTGRSTIPGGNEHAFVWTLGGGMLDIGVLPGAANSGATAINNVGVVVGMSEGVPGVPPRAFRWTLVGGMENLGSFGAGIASFSAADALNDAGLIAGQSSTPAFDRHAFRWTALEGLVDIDTLGSSFSLPRAVGAAGQVSGTVSLPGFINHAFFWTQGTGMLDLGTAGGLSSAVIAMSANAHIAGVVETLGGVQHAMSWTQGAGMLDIGTLGGTSSRAQAVNSKGAIVGNADTRKEEPHAFLWSAKQGMLDLNKRLRHPPPGFVLETALAINDSGAIVANSNAGVVLLRPVQGHKDGKGQYPPVLGPITAPGLARLGAPVQARLGFVDEDRTGTRSVTWSWGDGSGSHAARVNESNGLGSAWASHRYETAGIHVIKATVLDRAGRSAETGRIVVAYDPATGVAAGNGKLDSPLGALRSDSAHSGRAHFAFIASPGRTGQFHFAIDGLVLRSDTLRQAGGLSGRGVFEGSATVNGRAGYQFSLAATGAAAGRGGVARLGLRIWHTDPVSNEHVVDYDNQRRDTARSGAGMAGAGAAGPRIAMPESSRLHPGGARIVEGGLAFH